jgi:RNA polymerase sigma-70 factor (ECF subfamily)
MDVRDEMDLVCRSKAGDTTAFDELVNRHVQVVYNLALRLVGNVEDAWDLTQGTFLKAWRGIDGFDSRRRFFSWLYRIALNESLNLLRSRRPQEALDERIADPSPSPAALADEHERQEAVHAALMDLDEGHRKVIVLRHFADLSYAELSDVFGVPQKTIKSRLFTARQMLGRILERRGFAE